MSSPKTVIFRAPSISVSGYGVHSRMLASWLLKRQEEKQDIEVTFELLPWGITPWFVDPNACDGLIGKIIQHSGNRKDNYDISFQLQLPNEWNPFLAKTNIGITAGVEADRCNPAWITAINRMNQVIVPSEFTKNCFENTGDVKTKINVIPESWFEECRNATQENSVLKGKLNLETDFNFLVVSQFTGNNPENDRKNISYTLKWLLEEFYDASNVGVVVKTNFGRQTKLDKQNTLKALSQLLLECRRGAFPRIYLLHGQMSDKELVGLYTHPKIKALVNLSRGEGYGLPVLEAATCGLPVATTGWSAPTEFLGLGRYMKIDYSMVEIHESRIDGQIWVKGSRWANPIEADVKRKLKRFYQGSSIPKKWAQDLRPKLLEKYSPEAINGLYDSLLEELF